MKKLFCKYRELVTYVIFGALTTLVNFLVFWICEKLSPDGDLFYLINNAVAWFVSVIFAYITNKLFVFKEKSFAPAAVARELLQFFGARIFSFALEEAGLWLFVDVLGFSAFSKNVLGFNLTGEMLAKIILAVIVVILNYFFSKFIIFKSKNTADQ